MFELLKVFDFTSSPIINAIIKLSAFVLAAAIIDLIMTKVIRVIVRRTISTLDDMLIDITHKPILFTIILLGIFYSIIDIKPSQELWFYSVRIIYTLIVVVWMIALLKLTRYMVTTILMKIFKVAGMRHDAVPLISSLVRFTIVIISIFITLAIWGVDLTPIITSASIISAVILLAAKDSISNFFAGFSIILDQPYKIGDYIDLDNAERGEVVEIGLRSTRIKTRDDVLIAIPNSIIANSKIINESAPVKLFRVRIPIGVDYSSDIDLVEKVLLEVANTSSNIVFDPLPRVRFRGFGDSSLDLELLCWVREPALRGLTIHELNKEILKQFRVNNITIPFPQRDLHIYPSDQTSK